MGRIVGYFVPEKPIGCTPDGLLQLGVDGAGVGVGAGAEPPSLPGFRHGHGSDSQ
ncbi:hypothetical protein [Candidatus Solirubrobacter pratensis]|uniref:hypothetical protein n=1 Tax=Candidatus Solirubrobacter pratensis TaxID=1298857 RepID=UPI0012DDDB34|nr:hypothetical protein [Candidatus Solirubrobacter pratensis]